VLYALPQPTDRALSREAAKTVAGVLGSKVASDRQIVIGEPQCHYAVRLNTKHFWFGARFAPSSYVTQGTHKRIGSLMPPFVASLKAPNEAMLTEIVLPRASSELKVPVFVSEVAYGPIASEALCSQGVRRQLEKLDFSSIQSVFISPIQLRVIGKFSVASHVAEQIRAQRNLLECLYEFAMPPNKSLERTRER
jgi:hypothetical protein